MKQLTFEQTERYLKDYKKGAVNASRNGKIAIETSLLVDLLDIAASAARDYRVKFSLDEKAFESLFGGSGYKQCRAGTQAQGDTASRRASRERSAGHNP